MCSKGYDCLWTLVDMTRALTSKECRVDHFIEQLFHTMNSQYFLPGRRFQGSETLAVSVATRACCPLKAISPLKKQKLSENWRI